MGPGIAYLEQYPFPYLLTRGMHGHGNFRCLTKSTNFENVSFGVAMVISEPYCAITIKKHVFVYIETSELLTA